MVIIELFLGVNSNSVFLAMVALYKTKGKKIKVIIHILSLIKNSYFLALVILNI